MKFKKVLACAAIAVLAATSFAVISSAENAGMVLQEDEAAETSAEETEAEGAEADAPAEETEAEGAEADAPAEETEAADTEAPAETEAGDTDVAAEAAADDTNAVPEADEPAAEENDTSVDANADAGIKGTPETPKESPDTGIEGIASITGLGIIAVGAVIVTRKKR